jgi:histone H3/H4
MSDPTATTETEPAATATAETEPAEAPTTAPTTPTDKSAQSAPPPSAVEFEPPLACVRRILKNSLPSSTNVGKDASAAFARACGIFIIYLTACSNDFAREHKRQTITANDVLAAIKVSTGYN